MRPHLTPLMRLFVTITWMALALLAFGGCATLGPSSFADGSRSETRFNPGSALYLSSEGDWSGSSAQPTQQSGGYMTDDEQSAIMPGNASGVRGSRNAFGILTGGDIVADSISFTFGAEGEDGEVVLKDVDLKGLRVESDAFYEFATAMLPAFEAVSIALGEQSTQQKISQLDALKATLPDWNQLARDVIDHIIDGLVPIPSLPAPPVDGEGGES